MRSIFGKWFNATTPNVTFSVLSWWKHSLSILGKLLVSRLIEQGNFVIVRFPDLKPYSPTRSTNSCFCFVVFSSVPRSVADGGQFRRPQRQPGQLYQDWRRLHRNRVHRDGENNGKTSRCQEDGSSETTAQRTALQWGEFKFFCLLAG